MTVTALDVCNQALSEASGRGRIASLDETSAEAAAANMFYAQVRDQVLRAARWGCARKTARLTLLKAAPNTPENVVTVPTDGLWTADFPPPPWLYMYTYPSDCVYFWHVLRNSNPSVGGVPIFSVVGTTNQWSGINDGRMSARFEIASDTDGDSHARTVVLTNEPNALGVYGRQLTDPTVWDPTLREAVVQALAGKFAIAISGDKEMGKLRLQTANQMILNARVANANEGLTTNERDADWIAARGMPALGALPGGVFGPYGPLFTIGV